VTGLCHHHTSTNGEVDVARFLNDQVRDVLRPQQHAVREISKTTTTRISAMRCRSCPGSLLVTGNVLTSELVVDRIDLSSTAGVVSAGFVSEIQTSRFVPFSRSVALDERFGCGLCDGHFSGCGRSCCKMRSRDADGFCCERRFETMTPCPRLRGGWLIVYLRSHCSISRRFRGWVQIIINVEVRGESTCTNDFSAGWPELAPPSAWCALMFIDAVTAAVGDRLAPCTLCRWSRFHPHELLQ